MTENGKRMLRRACYDLNVRWLEAGPSNAMLIAMVCDPRTYQGMQRVDKDTGIDACGLTTEQRERAIQLFMREVTAVESAAKEFTVMVTADAVSAVSAVEPAECGNESDESSEADNTHTNATDADMGDADMFAGMDFGTLPGMTSLPTLPSEQDTKAEVSQAESFLEMLKTVPLKELLKDGCQLPADENQVIDLWAVTEVEPFFVGKVKDMFPFVYRVALKFLPRAIACCFQERVFSTAKNVMQLNATRLGHRLFAAMVRLRHNSALIESWTSQEEVVRAPYDIYI